MGKDMFIGGDNECHPSHLGLKCVFKEFLLKFIENDAIRDRRSIPYVNV